ncbi:hypothetical protein KSS87_020294 [Heliosperma pusillum]|nr:hypothetical protein KSS87_020294 [Heliosperma pusillum]
MDNNILLKLKVSYDRLNDRNLQLCFLNCVLYPEDYPIWRETLIELWIMEGLLDDVESRHDQVNKGHSIINKLENVCLLQSAIGPEPSDSDCCVKMHDLIRDMAIFITRDNPRFIVKAGMHLEEVPGEENWTEDPVKISLMGNKIQEIPCQMSPRCSNLSVLFLQNNPLKKIPNTFFTHMTSVTLLDLSATEIETLPDSVANLESLRLLLLQFCAELVYVPSLSKLTKLKVLNLYGTKIDEAPMGIEGLSHLEEISCGWKVTHLNAFNRYIECQHFRQLRYYGFWLREPGASLGSAIPSLYDAIELKNLHIRECKGLEYISSHSQSISLPSILTPLGTVEYLELFGLCDLRGLIKVGGEAPASGTFSHLGTFIIEKCSRIKKLFPINMVKQQQSLLPYLEYIKVSGCEELEEIFTETCEPSLSDVIEAINPTNAIISLPKVRILKLLDLPNLKSICCRPLLCSSLQNFCKEECPKLNLVPLSGPFLCDSSPSSLSSLHNNEQWWQWLKQHYPHDAHLLQSYMDIQQTESYQA